MDHIAAFIEDELLEHGFPASEAAAYRMVIDEVIRDSANPEQPVDGETVAVAPRCSKTAALFARELRCHRCGVERHIDS